MGLPILHKTVQDFERRSDLLSDTMEPVFDALISETDASLLSQAFSTWNEKGLSASEISGLARIMRSRMKRIRSRHAAYVDSVGTGGSRAKTFNVSTAAAFVIAGAGVPVAKHGNRAATSRTGSTDALSELGVNADIDPLETERHLNDAGICFMFAPRFHSLSPLLAKVRRELKFPTVFNCLGPLSNPAEAPHQLIGVWSKDLVVKMAEALSQLGTAKSWIVHGEDGLDEITVRGRTFIAEVEGDQVRYFDLSPSDFGIDNGRIDVPTADTPSESALIIRKVLDGALRDTPAEQLVLLNAAAAIYISGFADSLKTAMEMARISLFQRKAAEKLEMLAKFSGRELR